jgi:crotonobetainyl-CoA:carnitine CoA-transferase CaiB-like acyl-CoA transferase
VTDVMRGVRVVEVAHYVFAPSAGAVLADWGADVIKVEHPAHGDPIRGVNIGGIAPGTNGFTFMWELSNRGKRSIGIDLRHNDGLELLHRLVSSADVFLTSYLPEARLALNIDETSIRTVNERVIYAVGSGQGSRGTEANTGAFDQTTFWYRTGIADAVTAEGATPPGIPGPGFGDLTSGLALAGGIAAALFKRERGEGPSSVEASLFATGLWANQANITAHSITGTEFRWPDRTQAINPLVNTYRTADDRHLGIHILAAQRDWAAFCTSIGHPELTDDPRFATSEERAENRNACIAVLDDIFAAHSLAHWQAAFATQRSPWAVIKRASETHEDPQVAANGFIQEVVYDTGRSLELVAAPVQFDGAAHDLAPAPELGSSTEEVLLELGFDWAEIGNLKDTKAVS